CRCTGPPQLGSRIGTLLASPASLLAKRRADQGGKLLDVDPRESVFKGPASGPCVAGGVLGAHAGGTVGIVLRSIEALEDVPVSVDGPYGNPFVVEPLHCAEEHVLAGAEDAGVALGPDGERQDAILDMDVQSVPCGGIPICQVQQTIGRSCHGEL